ncbi:MAG: hypothetical protein KDD33_01355 [Bdellovibrionales bacterium]|nr:hypothetical protein [Bdellovibrionales bacterium]
MKYVLILISLILFSSNGYASRIVEIEDYYSKKATDFIKTRFPEKPFTVYVKVETDGSQPERRLADSADRGAISLPYLDSVSEDQVNFWSRKDLSLGTLLGYLKSVYVKIDIDSDMAEAEKDQFRDQIYQYLKLSPIHDRVEISEKSWGSTTTSRQKKLFLGIGAGLLLFGFFLFFIAFQNGIRTLVKGIAGPLADIGKSTETFAANPAVAANKMPQTFMDSISTPGPVLSDSQMASIKSQISDCLQVFENPNGVLIRAIEDLGYKYPHAMGSIFKELPPPVVKSLFRYGRGQWWYTAITEPSQLNQNSAKIMDAILHIKLRIELSEKEENSHTHPENRELELVLSRLDHKMFGQLLKNKKFDEAAPILRLLPRDLMIKVSKYLYPGQWAELLGAKQATTRSEVKNVKKLIDEAIELKPLQSADTVEEYFAEHDLIQYLDTAVTKDEREVYRVLPDTHRVKQSRFPFYQVFQSEENVLQNLSLDISIDEWALVFTHCDQEETTKIENLMTQRQKFLLKQYRKQQDVHPTPIEALVGTKRKIMSLCKAYVEKRTATSGEMANEASA